jgi:hypothetical protein
MADMRRLLGVLRDGQPAALGPQPQLADLPALVDIARKAGLSVERSAASAAFRRWSLRVPDRAGIAGQRHPARPRSHGHRVGGP